MGNPEKKDQSNYHEKHHRAKEIIDWMCPSVNNPQSYEIIKIGKTVRVTKTSEKNPETNDGLIRVTGERIFTQRTIQKIDEYIEEILPEIDYDKNRYFKIVTSMQNINKVRRLLSEENSSTY